MDKRFLVILLMILFIFCFLKDIYAFDFTITVPDQYVTRTRDAVCGQYHYDQLKEPGETKAEFVERMIKWKFLYRTVIDWEGSIARESAYKAIEDEVNQWNTE